MIMAIALALFVGFLLPLQAGVNAQLRVALGHPLVAAVASFIVGTIGLFACTLLIRAPWPGTGAVAATPWWLWTGGLLGAIYILLAIVLAPQLGAATLIALVVGGQMLSSLVLDHFGVAGYSVHPINLARVLGAVLVIVGVVLIQRN